jgi:ABC-type sugar transport system permease subunit
LNWRQVMETGAGWVGLPQNRRRVGYGAAIATVLTLIIVLAAVAIMRWQASSEANPD